MFLLLAASLVGFTLRAHTNRADYFVLEPGLSVNVRACEAFLERTEFALGVRVPRFSYYRVKTMGDVSQYGGFYARGSATPQEMRIVALDPCLRHEVVHLVAAQLGNPGQFWQEGLAVVMGGDRFSRLAAKRYALFWREKGHSLAHIEELGFDWYYERASKDLRDGLMKELYNITGGFVSYLLQVHGEEKVRFFFSLCRSPKDAPSAFQAVFGVSVETASRQWLGS